MIQVLRFSVKKRLMEEAETASNASSTGSQCSTCHVCHLQFASKNLFRQHLFCHAKQDLKRKYLPPGADLKKCRMCSYQADKLDSLLMHLALTHKLLKEFLPTHLAEELYPTTSVTVAPKAGTSRIVQATKNQDLKRKKLFTCPECKLQVSALFHLRQHLCKHFLNDIKEAAGKISNSLCPTCGHQVSWMKSYSSLVIFS